MTLCIIYLRQGKSVCILSIYLEVENASKFSKKGGGGGLFNLFLRSPGNGVLVQTPSLFLWMSKGNLTNIWGPQEEGSKPS